MSIHILHVLDHSIPMHSGYTFRTRAIINHQRELGWQTSHVTSAKHTAEGPSLEEVDGLQFYRTAQSKMPWSLLPALDQMEIVRGLSNRLDEVLEELKPDVLHAHSPALNGVAALRAAKRHKLPLVYEVRAFWEDAAVDHGTAREGGIRYRATRALETWLMRKADCVTTICEGLRSDIVQRGLSADKVTVIPNAVDLEKFTFGESADSKLIQTHALEDQVVLGFIGSFYAYEGLSLLLDALPNLKDLPIKLLLVGGGPQDALLRTKVESAGLQDRVIFTGRVPHDQVTDYYNLVDIFVYPRLPMRLTELVTPLKPLEAMAQGRLVLASDVGGHKELIRDGLTGSLFRSGNAQDLADKVRGLLDKRDDWGKRRQAAREFVQNERNWRASVARYISVYERAQGPRP